MRDSRVEDRGRETRRHLGVETNLGVMKVSGELAKREPANQRTLTRV